ncbi:MAG: helix-turn-helix domain-containing protein [Pseudomonadota bacterium]
MKKNNRSSSPVDAHVGAKLRTRRNLMGMSQDDLASQIDVTYQQVQKYENGMNRIGASRLYEISRVLKVAVGYFFEGLGSAEKSQGFAENGQAAFEAENDDILNRKETYELIRSYYQIKDVKLRQQILEMAKAMARSAKKSAE